MGNESDLVETRGKPKRIPRPAQRTLTCWAKINLALSVGGADPNGMHPLASWMVAVEYGDTLQLRRVDHSPSRFDIRFDESCPAVTGQKVDWPLDADLAYRAHALLEEHVGAPLAVDLRLCKRIPTGAGLGGGSSNAAATLVGLNDLLALNLDRSTLVELGGRLGSDVSFLVAAALGQTSALVTGLGETIEPAPMAQPLHMVLVFPGTGGLDQESGVSCATGEVYRQYDRIFHNRAATEPDPDRVRGVIRAVSGGDKVDPTAIFNDLSDPAFAVAPSLGQLRDRLESQLGQPVHVTGSGSTLFVLQESRSASEVLAAKIFTTLNLPAVATKTVAQGLLALD